MKGVRVGIQVNCGISKIDRMGKRISKNSCASKFLEGEEVCS